MSKYTKVLSMLQIAMFGLVACGGDDGAGSAVGEIAQLDTNTPDGAFLATIAAMKSNDLSSLIKNSLSESQYNDLVTEFENNKATNFSEGDKAQFAQMMGMFTADGAEDTLFAMAEPQLEQAKAMLPMMLMMGKDQVLQSIKSNPMLQKDSVIQQRK